MKHLDKDADVIKIRVEREGVQAVKRWFLSSFLLMGAIVLPASEATAQAGFVVNTISNIDDGECNNAHCSLSEAINAANSRLGADKISFNIQAGQVNGKYTISPTSSLPPILEKVSIDATTQPGFSEEPLIVLSGKNVVGPIDMPHYGFDLQSHWGSVIRGFIINDYLQDPGASRHIAISIFEGGKHKIVGNWLGMDATGLLPRPNGLSIRIQDSESNLVGGEKQSDRNILSGNSDSSFGRYFVILLVGSHHNRIEGNWLGLDKTGMAALPNNGEAILLFLSNYNVIGGSEAKRNVISATQKQQAIQVEDSGGNEISYNCLGTNKDCEVDEASYDTSPFANGFVFPHDTIDILSFNPDRFGNDNKVLHNVVAQNGQNGIVVVSIDTGAGNAVSGTVVEGNEVINSRFNGIGILSDGASSVLDSVIVRGNIIDNRTLPLDGSVSNGIFASGIIDDLLIEDNLVSHSATGIFLDTSRSFFSPSPTSLSFRLENVLLEGNSVRDSFNEGVVMKGSISDVSVIDNEITGSGSHGIAAVASTVIDIDSTSGNVGIENGLIKDNLIYNNGGTGVYLDAVLSVTFENMQENILFDGALETGGFDFIEDTVSTDFALYELRNDSVTNGSADDFDLIQLTTGFDFITGSFSFGSDEKIPVIFNPGDYIILVDAWRVGTVADPLSYFTAYKTTADLLFELSDRSHGIELSGNAIYGNAALGIDLSNAFNEDSTPVPDGVTEDMEVANGPNGLQNFPEITNVEYGNKKLNIAGTLDSEANTSYRIEIFASTTVDESGNGEGQFPLDSFVVTTNGAGQATFDKRVKAKAACDGDYITSTATRLRDGMVGLTSEFSGAMQLDEGGSSESCSRY
jgi:CSLREA domain-containing protein